MQLKKQKSSSVAARAWKLVRLALLWARKGGLLKNRLIMDLRLVPKYLKGLRHDRHLHHQQRGALHYGDRQLSFDETPIIHFKMHRPASLRFKMPNIPCINPSTLDFDYDFHLHDDHDQEMYYNYDVVARKSFLEGADDDDDDDVNEMSSCEACDQLIMNNPCDDEIDLKADKFIAKFYEQIKMQRQISYLQYNDMLNRGAN